MTGFVARRVFLARWSLSDLADVSAASGALATTFGAGGEAATAWAPGRCTLVGAHVDYAGGMALCIAIDAGVAVALHASGDGRWRAVSAGRVVEREDPAPAGDIGDRIFAAVLALRDFGIAAPACEVAVSATLPEGAGLASSAALTCAVIAALLRLMQQRVDARRFAAIALRAERDIVGVPCGPLDQLAIVCAPERGVLVLDCRTESTSEIEWRWGDAVVLCACDSGEQHDVGGAGYRELRARSDQVLAALGVSSCQDIEPAALRDSRLSGLDRRRAEHLVGEAARTNEAIVALREGNPSALGALMSASHDSLREDLLAGTDRVELMVGAARRVPGVHGAYVVGAGFGGTVVALCDAIAADACSSAMRAAAGVRAQSIERLRPSAGLAKLAPDAITS